MQQYPIMVPEYTSVATIAAAIEATLAASGLQITMKGTLKQYPGCLHWHAKRSREAGTLEVTLWPKTRQAWLSVHHNRSAAWIDALLPELQQALQWRFAQGC